MKKQITVALAGNPNTGKTTVFNALTGARQHVGNWPGVTVEKREGTLDRDGKAIHVVDLPGVYSLTAYSLDEVIARRYILEQKPDLVANIVDASNLERNLYLTTQLLEMGIPVVLVLNMMDMARSRGLQIDTEKLSSLLGVPVVSCVASRDEGTHAVLDTIISAAVANKPSISLNYGREVEHAITAIEELLQDRPLPHEATPRWTAIKLLEDDDDMIEGHDEITNDEAVGEARTKSLAHLTSVYGDEAETIIADARYGFISGLMKEVIRRPAIERVSMSDRIDRVVLNRWLGIPIFLAVLYGLFQLTFAVSVPFMGWIDAGFGWLADQAIGVEGWFGALLRDGIIGGLGSVLIFVPVIFLLYIALSILEDSGYMARAAFVMDRLMHKIGLHGRSFVPLMLGFGCNVPAIMATRTIENPKDRLVTILVNPLISCGARLPVYALLAGAFFTAHQGLVVFSMYAIGIILAILLAWLFRKRLVRGESGHFVMELPPYRMPTIKGVAVHTWERGRSFLARAGTIIFSIVLVIWVLDYAGALEPIGRAIAPIFAPAGFGQWQSAVTLVFGILAKEVVVGTFGTLLSAGEAGIGAALGSQLGWTPLIAYAFMVMTLVYVPCMATIAVTHRETGSWKWTFFMVGYTLILGWVLATLIYQIGSLFGG
jgi:ferrous iron transport protein B